MDNHDINEIDKFQEHAARWWDLSGPLNTLHAINPLRLKFIEENSSELSNKKIIDIGCGGGILTESLAKKYAQVTGIDLAKECLQVAKLHALESNLQINYLYTSAEEFANQHNAEFNIATCMEMLEHVPKPKAIIKAISEMLTPGGLAFFSTINRNLKSFMQAIVGAEYLLKILPKGTHHYGSFITPAELDSWCRENGLSAITFAGIDYNPLNKKFSLNDKTEVNYLACYKKV